MGLRTRLRETFRRRPAAESAPVVTGGEGAQRIGYEYGAALMPTTTRTAAAYSQERQQIMTQLYQAYLTCPWVAAPIDLIARTVTAGGLQVVSNAMAADGTVPPDSPEVTRLRRLMRYVNPQHDMVQLLRSAVIDLNLFGDAYIEIVSLLGEPVALYPLDSTTMTVVADAHGEVTGYVQVVDGLGGTRTADFTPEQVIHISLDAPRGGAYGVGPAQKALLPVTAWLFTEATIKECFRRGDPPRIHVDLAHLSDVEVQRWREQYMVFNLGPKAVGTPTITTGDGKVVVLDPRKVTDYLDASRQLRDEIIATFGVPPGKLGIIESGNLGGGTGESQDKTYRVNTVIPVQSLVLEKINFHLLQQGFGIEDWHLEFPEIDYRDSAVVEGIRDMRLRNGTYTRNRYADEIGEPPVPGGDEAVLVDRQNIVRWADMNAMSKAGIAFKLKGTSLEPDPPAPGAPVTLHKVADPVTPASPAAAPAASTGAPPGSPEDQPGLAGDALQGAGPRESTALDETWQRLYRARRAQALEELPPTRELVGAGR
ncbi:phage portal protein [Streptacidiphilus sp. EB129]|uniref:phage portal protein n=1 Tax=Streptacidiphilus sp. EB129 TaxID=3156262 RepID=UPI003517AAC8